MQNQSKRTSPTSRREFLTQATIVTTGMVIASQAVIGAPTILKYLGKPNSKINGVQIGTISYSFRSLPSDAEQILKYCIDCNISAIELMGNTAEPFAGAPHTSTDPRRAGPPAQRPQPTPEEEAENQRKAKEIADWRASVSMDKFIQLKKMYTDAGISIYAWKPAALGEKN